MASDFKTTADFESTRPNAGLLAGLLIGVLILGSARGASAQDTVFISGGAPIRGRVTGMTPEGVSVETGGSTRQVAAREIQSLQLGGEPPALAAARSRFVASRYEDTLGELDRIDSTPTERMIRHEIDFMRAYASAQTAIAGGHVTARQAGTLVGQFLESYPNSFRLYPATAMLGRLLLAIDRPDLAEVQFARLVQSDWPRYALEGRVQLGYTQLITGKYTEARQNLTAAQQTDANDESARQMRLVARALAARTLVHTGQVDEAIADLEEMVRTTDPDNATVLAHVYNGLGAARIEAGQRQLAVIALLHTDLLYYAESDAHAEALYHLADLWAQLNQPDRANRARQVLTTRYPGSLWAARR